MNRTYYTSPVGILCIESDCNSLTALYCVPNAPTLDVSDHSQTPILVETERQLSEYFKHQRKAFDLPLAPHGTPFQCKVWEALQTIPYGETWSYADVAAAVGTPHACRAVGGANNRNPIMILIPCHRVIGKNGSLTGFGAGIEVKEYLLNLERETIDSL